MRLKWGSNRATQVERSWFRTASQLVSSLDCRARQSGADVMKLWVRLTGALRLCEQASPDNIVFGIGFPALTVILASDSLSRRHVYRTRLCLIALANAES
jgi:hypothetical protein